MSDGRESDGSPAPSVPLSGSTLILGPSGAGKTRLTARSLETWIKENGTDGVVVLEFGPSIEHDGGLVGGRLDRFVEVPGDVWYGVLESHAPRLQGEDEAESHELARSNAERATRLFEAMPAEPKAVFVNDATIPFQHDSGDPESLTRYCDRADCAVVNSYEGEGLGTDDSVSLQERAVLETLRRWADRVIRLE